MRPGSACGAVCYAGGKIRSWCRPTQREGIGMGVALWAAAMDGSEKYLTRTWEVGDVGLVRTTL